MQTCNDETKGSKWTTIRYGLDPNYNRIVLEQVDLRHMQHRNTLAITSTTVNTLSLKVQLDRLTYQKETFCENIQRLL